MNLFRPTTTADWKRHFIAGLCTLDPDFKMSLWCELVPQGELTINHLRSSSLDPNLSAYEGLHGSKFDFVAHPIHPLGTKGVVLEPVSTRESWAPHGLDGFYVGLSLDHYQCFRIYVIITNDFRTTDSLSWHPKKLHLPGSSKEELIHAKAEEILHLLQNHSIAAPDGTLSQREASAHGSSSSGWRSRTSAI
jgi:hypothetical protein